jgi:hypothetical protein
MNLKKAAQYYDSPEYKQKLIARMTQMKNCADDDFHRARMMLDVWAADPIEFIETFLFLKIPNYQNAIKPFFMFDYQKRIIFKLLEAENDTKEHIILIDKPREMGITWVITAYYLWRWLFTANWSGFILSRTESEVDDGSTSPDNSIFGKIRWLMSKCPEFLFPESFTPKGKKGTNTDMSLKILNPLLQSSINGSSTNQNAGRSRRYSISFIDECFFIENFLQVMRSLESVSRVKVLVSSSRQGRQYEKFKDMCEANGDYIHLDWQDHPWKDQEWFEQLQKRAEADPEVLREAVVSYSIDKKSQYYPQIDQAKVESIEYDPKRPVYISMDIGRGDLTVLVWWQYNGASFNVIECYSNKNKDIDWYAPFMNPEINYDPDAYRTEYQKKLLEKIKKWQKPKAWFGEQAHFSKTMPTNRSCADGLLKYGIRLLYNSYATTYEPRRRAVIQILPMTVFNKDSDSVMELYDALMNSRYSNVVAPTSVQSVLKPVHDPEISDFRCAFENGACNLPRVLRLQRNEPRTEEGRNLTNQLMRYMRI